MAEDRLDRLEALAEKILEGLQETRQLLTEDLQETKHLTNSNARAIEALATQSAENQKQWERDRKGIYLLLGQLTRSMSDFYDIQSDFYNRFDQIDARQLEIAKIIEHFKTDKTDQENQN